MRAQWALAPTAAALEPAEAAVWRLDAATSRPIETILARYLRTTSPSVTLRRSSTGKPEVDGSSHRVSLAHSGDVALVAVARERDVGVDVERPRVGADTWSLISHALTERERASLDAFPATERSAAFLSIWTRKEALLKAVGAGLSLDPQLIELDGCAIVAVPPELGRADDWTLVDLPVPGYAAALALTGPVSRLLLYDAR